MSTLADFVNAPTEIVFKGTTYHLRQPNQLEEGMFQRWLEQRALEAIERGVYAEEARRDRDRQLHFQDVATGVYEAGGAVYAKASMMPSGMAKMLSIICKDQLLTEAVAKELVKHRLKEICATLISKATSDPKVLEATLATLGLPSDYFSSNLQTPREGVPETPPPSSECPPTNSCASSTSSGTTTAPPG